MPLHETADSARIDLHPSHVDAAGADAPPSPEELRRLSARAAALLRESVLTLAALPDRERAWLSGPRPGLPSLAMTPAERQREFGLDAALVAAAEAQEALARRAARFRPTPEQVARAPAVLAWLAWLRRQNDGDRDMRIIIARAHGAPLWRLAQRFGRSDRTIARWEAGSVAAIVNRFWREIREMEGRS